MVSRDIYKIFENNSCKTAYHGKSLVSVLREFFAYINNIIIFVKGLGTRLSFYEVL